MYLVFAWDCYGKCGGANDIRGSFSNIDDALKFLKTLIIKRTTYKLHYRYDEFQIYGVDENAIIFNVDTADSYACLPRTCARLHITINQIDFKGVLIDD